jgi:hypothetical protein
LVIDVGHDDGSGDGGVKENFESLSHRDRSSPTPNVARYIVTSPGGTSTASATAERIPQSRNKRDTVGRIFVYDFIFVFIFDF